MTRHNRIPPLLRAIQILLPEAELRIEAMRHWHSMTFHGQQLTLSARIGGPDPEQRAAKFASYLPQHEFAIPGQLVADATVVSIRETSDGVVLSIEALVLDD